MTLVRHILLLILELLGSALAAGFVLLTLLVWRLSEGPLQLEGLQPYIEQAIADVAAPYKVAIGESALTQGQDGASLGVEAKNVRVLSATGEAIVSLPAVQVDISLPSLLLGRMAPRAIYVRGAQVRLVRLGNAQVEMSFVNQSTSSAATSDVLDHWLSVLSDEPDSRSLMGSIRSLKIESSSLLVDDRQYNVRWVAPNANLSLVRDDEGMSGRLQLDIATGSQLSTLKGGVHFNRQSGVLRADLDLDRFNPAALVGWSPSFADFAKVNVPLSGKLGVIWMRPLGVQQVSFDFAAGAGQVSLVDGQPPVDVRYGKLLATINRQKREANIDELTLDFAPAAGETVAPHISATAQAVREGDDIVINQVARIATMPATALVRYWPPAVAKGAYAWIMHNITAGTIPEASAVVRLRVPLATPDAVKVEHVAGGMKLDNLTVHYFRPLPPVTEASGRAQFDQKHFLIRVDKGLVGDIKMPTASVNLLGLDDDSERAEIDLTIQGSLASQLQLLDNPPLRYASRMNLNAAAATGTATTRAQLLIPLYHDLPIEDVGIAAAAHIKDAGLPKIVAGQDLTKGNLELTLDGGGMQVVGTGTLGGAKAEFKWNESFTGNVSPSSAIAFKGTLGEEARQAFHISWPEVLGGDVAVDGTYTKDRGQPAKLNVAMDLAQATLTLPWFGWSKPVGDDAKGAVSVLIDKQDVASIPAFNVKAAGTDVSGSVRFAEKSRWDKVTLDSLNTVGTRLSGSVTNRPLPLGLLIDLKGSHTDVSALLGDDKQQDITPVTEAAVAPPPVTSVQPLEVQFNINRVVTGVVDGQSLTNARGRIVRSLKGWSVLDVDAQLQGNLPMRVKLLPTPTGHSLEMRCDDAGLMLSALRLMENIRGGVVRVTGQGQGGGAVLGEIDLKGFRYLNARTLQKIAAAAQPNGAEALGKDEGIYFKRFNANIEYDEASLRLRKGRMAGDILGLTLQGNLDLLNHFINLEGTIVPLYGINSALGGIPLVGWLLTGGNGGGVFAATYGVKGNMASPETSVNPLAILAPGFLRELFFISGD